MKLTISGCRRALLVAAAFSLPLSLSISVRAQTNYYFEFSGANGANGDWDLTTANWATPNFDSTPLTTWLNNGSATALIDANVASRTVTIQTDINAQGLVFEGYSASGSGGTKTFTVAGSSTLTLASSAGFNSPNITFDFPVRNSVPSTTGIINSEIDDNVVVGSLAAPGDLTVNVTGNVTAGFGNNSLKLFGTNTLANLNIGAGILGPQSAAPQNLVSVNNFPLMANINFTGNGASFAADTTTQNFVTVVSNGNFNINPGAATYMPGKFTARIGATNGNELDVNGVISGNGDLMFAAGFSGGGGTVVLANQNTYAGTTSFNGTGTGTPGSASLLVVLGTSGGPRIDNVLPVGTKLIWGFNTNGNGGTLDLNGNNQAVSSLYTPFTAGVDSKITNNDPNGLLSTLTISGSDSPGVFGVPITDGQSAGKIAIVRTGTGTTIFTQPNNPNSYSGGTTILGGTLSIDRDSELGTPIASNTLTINGGTLAATGAGFTLSSNRQILVGPSTGTGSGTISVATNGNLAYDGAIANNGGSGGLTVTGGGTLTLGAANSYTGPTTINGATLSLTSGGSIHAASAVTIGAGGTLSGTGTAAGAVTVNGTISPASTATTGQLNVGSLALSGGGAYTWELSNATGGAGSGWDLISVGGGTGTVTLNNTSSSKFTINVLAVPSGVASFDSTQTYTWKIIDDSVLAGSAFNANLFNINTSGFGAGGPGSTITISKDAGNAIDLVYNPGPVLVWKQGVGGSGNWTATGGTDWSGSQWNSAKSALFNAPAPNPIPATVTLQTPITATGLEFDVSNYTIAGSGVNKLTLALANGATSSTLAVTNPSDSATISAEITGAAPITKSGGGTLILTGPNSFTGPLTIATGTVQAAAASLPSDITNSGTLVFNQGVDDTYVHNLSGTGAIIKQNSGALTLSGTNTGFTGPITVTAGAVVVDSNARLGGTATALTLNGGTLRASAGFTSNRPIMVGDGVATSPTAIFDTGSNTVIMNGSSTSLSQITLTNGGTFIKRGTGELQFRGTSNTVTGVSAFTHPSGSNPGTVQVDGGMLTIGDTTQATSPQGFFGPTGLGQNLVLNDGTTLRDAASASAGSSFNTLNSLTVNGNAKIIIFRTTVGGANSMSPSLTTNGTIATPLALNGTLTIDGGGNLSTNTPRVSVGALTLTGDSTLQMVASPTFQTNFTEAGTFVDHGHALTFLGGGTATQVSGAGIRINAAAGPNIVTGNWIIGNAQGTQGVSVSVGGGDNLSFTSGNVVVNPYGQLMFFSTTNSFTYGAIGQTLTLNGIGAQTADFSAGTSGALNTAAGINPTYIGNVVLASDSVITVSANTASPPVGSLTLTGAISGTGTLQKQGTGNLIILSNANTTTQNVLVGNGTVTVGDGSSLSHHDALLPSGNLTLGETSGTGAATAVVFRTDAQTIGNLTSTFALATGNASQIITLQGTNLTQTALTINETSNTAFGLGAVSTLTSKITGVGSVTLGSASTGTLTFTSGNDYSGGTTINGGKLELATTTIGANQFFGSIVGGNVAINANGILGVTNPANLTGTTTTALINSGGTMSIDADFDASPMVDPASIGILALNTNNSHLLGTNGSSAFIGAYNSQSLTTITLAPGAGGTYRLGGDGGTLTVTNGVLTGSTNSLIVGSTQPNGAGTVVLAAANTFGGGTTVNNGTLRTTANGALSTGGLAINAVAAANSTASIQSNETVSSLSSSVSGGGTATLSIAAGKTLTDNQAGNTTFAGTLNNSGTLTKSGAGTLEITAAPLLATGSALAVNESGKLRFNVTSNSAFVGTGVVATVSDSAVLELAGTVSALDPLVVKGRADVMNNSNAAAGLLVTGQNQQVGGINGSGTTQVNADAQLTADHIVQSALVIGGSAGHPALVTIDASDATGNPLASVTSLSPSGTSASIGSFSSSSTSGVSMPTLGSGTLGSGTTGINAVGSAGTSLGTGGGAAAVPEPSAIALALFALAAAGFAIRRRVA